MVMKNEMIEFALLRHILSSARSQLHKKGIFKRVRRPAYTNSGGSGSVRKAKPLASGAPHAVTAPTLLFALSFLQL